MATSLTGISPRPMLMGAPHDALRASNAGASLRVDRLFVQVAADFKYCASAFSAVKLCAAISPYSPSQTVQTALCVQVAVPPWQFSVSVWLVSRLQIRVWVFSSLFCVQTPQSWSSALPEKKVVSSAVPSELRPQTAQDFLKLSFFPQ